MIIGVHIADVTALVKAGGGVDREARVRGTTVYLPDRRIDMLPAVYSEDLCSLHENVERYAMSALWRCDASGRVVVGAAPWFGRVLLRSTHALSYARAQRLVDSSGADDNDDDDDDEGNKMRDARAVAADLTSVVQAVSHVQSLSNITKTFFLFWDEFFACLFDCYFFLSKRNRI